MQRQQILLWSGDLMVIGLVTLIGFATHGELQQAGLRILTTLIPLGLAWLIVALPGGLFSVHQALNVNQLWRPLWGAVLAGPLAVLLRALMLELRPVIPIFAFVLTGIFATAIFTWRLMYCLLFRSKG